MLISVKTLIGEGPTCELVAERGDGRLWMRRFQSMERRPLRAQSRPPLLLPNGRAPQLLTYRHDNNQDNQLPGTMHTFNFV